MPIIGPLFPVTNSAFVAVIALTRCQKISITEDPSISGFPTADFFIAKPTASDGPRRMTAGAIYDFTKPNRQPALNYYQPGDIAGYVKMVSGTTSFSQDES